VLRNKPARRAVLPNDVDAVKGLIRSLGK